MKNFFGKVAVTMALIGGFGAFSITGTGCSKGNKKACDQYIQQMCSKNEKSKQCQWVKAKIEELGGATSDRALDFCQRNLKK